MPERMRKLVANLGELINQLSDAIMNLLTISIMKNLSGSISPNHLGVILSKICELTDFHYGEIWLPNPENNFLELSPISHVVVGNHQDDLENFRLCSQDFILSKGEGLPGRVWLYKQPEWMLDISAESERYFLRNQIAKAFGVRTGFAVPRIIEEKVFMILAFFACDIRFYSPEYLALAKFL
ncbi:GAF domain-containing protein [Nostoc sp.]|uniref:GAF domain-containing protein n=1 Tax=Nostoc sp. TaxID=1180 RepID=UPI002FF03FA0